MNSDKNAAQPFFCFQLEDKWLGDKLVSITRTLLRRTDLTPATVQLLAALLHSLKRLPRITEEVSLEASLTYESEDSRDTYSLMIDGERLELESDYAEYTSAGTERESKRYLRVSKDDCEAELVGVWINNFAERACDESCCFTIGDNKSNPNWSDDESNENWWEKLPSHYDNEE